ncbi:hypothetical protein WJX84_008257 [Apatococcus fuscideae]|uniref:Uncharacterized protein n=1 Tax=Apatococcus fuscideae TaxID=2026836 RepID=A0AAW1TF35_9CHLO
MLFSRSSPNTGISFTDFGVGSNKLRKATFKADCARIKALSNARWAKPKMLKDISSCRGRPQCKRPRLQIALLARGKVEDGISPGQIASLLSDGMSIEMWADDICSKMSFYAATISGQ